MTGTCAMRWDESQRKRPPASFRDQQLLFPPLPLGQRLQSVQLFPANSSPVLCPDPIPFCSSILILFRSYVSASFRFHESVGDDRIRQNSVPAVRIGPLSFPAFPLTPRHAFRTRVQSEHLSFSCSSLRQTSRPRRCHCHWRRLLRIEQTTTFRNFSQSQDSCNHIP